MEFDLENPLTSFKEHQADTIPALFATESDHMPSLSLISNVNLASLRSEAISLFSQFSYNLDPFTSYLALNYVDRFIYRHEMPLQGKPWIARLLVISCLSLAAKIRNSDFSLPSLQNDGDLIFDAQSIHRMEILILTSLNWRMRSITPFSFLYFFLSLFELNDPSLSQALKNRVSQILFKSHYETKILEYKPSVVAASALLCASDELCPEQSLGFKAAISSCGYVVKENLVKCWGVLKDMVMNEYECGVDALTAGITTESNSGVVVERESVKRRKLNSCVCNDGPFQLPQIQHCSSLH